MPDQASSTLMPRPSATRPHDALAPDLVALFLGATPHPDIVIPEPRVTLADLAAAARARSADDGGATVLRWDAAGQRFAS